MGVPGPCEGVQRGKRGPMKQVSESRKVRKPMMEKRRRDRINTCLTTLSAVLLEAGNGTPSDDSSSSAAGRKRTRLEKADILEQTVAYFCNLSGRRNKTSELKEHDDKKKNNSFILGYESCIEVVDSFLKELEQEEEVASLRNSLNHFLNVKLSNLSPSGDEHVPLSKANDWEGSKITSQSESNVDKMISFVPKLLPDGSLALVIKDENVEECVLKGNSPFLLSGILPQSSDTESENSPPSSSDEDELDEAELISECLQKNKQLPLFSNGEDGDDVWRPWDDCHSS